MLSFFITALGYFFFLWARGGRLPVIPHEIDEIEQSVYAPAASGLLFLIAVGLIIYGLYNAYLVSWANLFLNFFGSALFGGLIFFLTIGKFFR